MAASLGGEAAARQRHGDAPDTAPWKPSPLAVSFQTDDPIPSPPADNSGEEDDMYGEDDAQSVIQPAMSPVVTRLTSPRTPAAERVAAMDQVLEGYFDGQHEGREDESSGEETPKQLEFPRVIPPEASKTEAKLPDSTSIPPTQPHTVERLPSPWRATGPEEMVSTSPSASANKLSVASALEGSRHRRSSSTSTEALKRLSKALPSISLPSNFMPNRIPTPSFFSSSNTSSSRANSPRNSPPSQSPVREISNHDSLLPVKSQEEPQAAEQDPERGANLVRNTSAVSRRSLVRRSTSDESILYHSLSRMSSFGDDQRFSHIREQVNSRLKAIVDSFDTPTFKLPSMPSTLSLKSPLKKTEFSLDEISNDPNKASVVRAPKVVKDPLDSVLENLTGDLVIMGGYRGSILRSAEPPHRQLWVPIKVGLNVRKVNLEVGLDPEDEETMEERIIPSGMLKNIGPIDISKKLFKKLRESENARTGKLRVHDYGYDWRLSPHILSRKLVEFLRSLPSNCGEKPGGALVIAHSLGGVITRHAVNQAPELFSGVVYAGAPQRCINILGPLRNGDAVLLNEKVLTAHVNFSLRTTFVFLPEDGFCFVDKATGKEYNIDFFNPDDWVKHRLCPSAGEPALPPPTAKRNGSIGSFLSLPDSLTLNRGRSTSDPAARKRGISPQHNRITKDRTLAPQMDSSSAPDEHQKHMRAGSPPKGKAENAAFQAKNLTYLSRTLADIKRFRAELQHNPTHQAANVYPPISVIYGKDIPTVYAARVSCREAIATTEAYDDLVFRSGDGVVLAREAMPPPGYEIAKGGRISTDKGHISILGDLNAVGRALASVVRGRRKGIGLGEVRT